MIAIVGRIEVHPDDAPAFCEVIRPLIIATRSEAGCSYYDFHRDLDDPGVFHVVEEFADQEALAAHVETEAYQEFTRARRALRVEKMSAVQYDVSDRNVLF